MSWSAPYRAALAHLEQSGALQTRILLAHYRAHPPLSHSGAAEPMADLDLIASLDALGGPALLSARAVHVVAAPPRALPNVETDGETARLALPDSPTALADALAIAIALLVEADKVRDFAAVQSERALADALGVEASALTARFGDLERALAALRALARGGPEVITREKRVSSALDEVLLKTLAGDDEIVVCAGAVELVHDVISPYARRLRERLDALTGQHSDDARYDALALLAREAPETHDERIKAEARDGLTPAGDALLIRCEKLKINDVDPRASAALNTLKQQRAKLLVTGRSPQLLQGALEAFGPRVRAVALFSEGMASGAINAALDDDVGALACPGTQSSGERSASGLVNVPSLGLCPNAVPGLTLFRELSAATSAAIAKGALSPEVKVLSQVTPPGDTKAAAEAAAFALQELARA